MLSHSVEMQKLTNSITWFTATGKKGNFDSLWKTNTPHEMPSCKQALFAKFVELRMLSSTRGTGVDWSLHFSEEGKVQSILQLKFLLLLLLLTKVAFWFKAQFLYLLQEYSCCHYYNVSITMIYVLLCHGDGGDLYIVHLKRIFFLS